MVVGPVVCPPQPTGLTAAAQDSGALVTWDNVRAVVEDELTVLAEDGVEDLPATADVVTDIQVTVRAVADPLDEQVVTVTGDATPARVSGLRNGVEYAVSVIAFGEFGAGPVSEPVSVVPTTGVEGEIGGVLLKRDEAAKTVPASQSASNVDGIAVTDDGEALDGVDKVALSEAVDVAEGEAIARTIEAQPEVQWAEPDLVVLPATTDSSGNDAGAGWNITGEYGVGQVTDPKAGAGVTVAVIDTGITAHPDLDGRLVAGYDFVSNPQVLAAPRTEGADAVPFDGDYADEAAFGSLGRDAAPTDPGDWRGVAPIRDSTWHGTHTAGVIADVVPGAQIQPIRALSWRGGLLSDVAAGITWASGGTVDGVPTNTTPSKVINLSFSVQAACPNTLQTAIDDAVARGSVIVAAAGNNNDDATGYAPGNCANVITIGATNADGKRANYSNYGTVVDASAPGETPRTERKGTSIAAAHTAAALALIAAQQPGLSPDQLAAELTGTYLRAFPGDTCDEAGDKSCGIGIVQIATGPVPFTCQPKLYQSAAPGPRLYVYDPVENEYSTVGPVTSGGWNGMGYNTADDFIYGNNGSDKKLFRLDAAGTYETLGYLGTGFNSGDFWGPDRLLLGSNGSNLWKSVQVSDPDNPVVTNFTLTGDTFGGNAADFTVLGNTAYGLSPNGTASPMTLSVVNLITQVVVNKTTSGAKAAGGTGAAYADALGNVYFHANGGSVYRILAEDLDDPNPLVTSMGSPPTNTDGDKLNAANDGASCPDAASAFSATITNVLSSSVSDTSANLTADVNPNGASTTALICYGTTSATSGGALQGCTPTSQFANASDDNPLTGSTVTGLRALTLTGLTARTTYYWQVVTTSSATTTYGSVASFTTTSAPLVTTERASSVVTTTATVNGIVNPGSLSTDVSFCYGTASDLSGCTPVIPGQSPLPAGISDQSVSATLSGLTPGTTYYVRVSATNTDGTTDGSIRSFTTTAPPEVAIGAASGVTPTDARLNATVNPQGLTTSVSFCYGTAVDFTGCTSVLAAESPLVAVDANLPVTADLTGLSAATTYYVRASATNADGTTVSVSGSFTTDPTPLVVTTTTGALTTGVVGTAYSRTLSAAGGTAPYTWAVIGGSLPAGLSLDATTGTVSGTPTTAGDESFTIEVTGGNAQSDSKAFSLSVMAQPEATASAATSVATTSATLNGAVNPGNSLTTVDFCVGTSLDLSGCTVIAADESPLAKATTSSTVSAGIDGLTLGTTYYARVQAGNSAGSGTSPVVSFTTTAAPAVTTGTATFRDKDGEAILNASVNPKGSNTTVSFCWGTTPTLVGCTSAAATQSPVSGGSSTVNVSRTVAGLSLGVTYYFNVTATNAAGTTVGSTVEFTMPTSSAPTPTITSVSPNTGEAAGGESITISGTNFSTTGIGVTVSIGGVDATVTDTTATAITVTTPPGGVGAADVIVSNNDGQAVRETGGFTYTSASYTLTYDGNGATAGSVPVDGTDYTYGSSATVTGAGTLVRGGYEFLSWNTAANGSGTTVLVAAGLTITGNTTLYAQWAVALTVAPSTVEFGSVATDAGAPSAQLVTVTNAGDGAISVLSGGISITGSAALDFTVSGGTCAPSGVIAAGSSCTIEVAFDPSVAGARSASVSVATTAGTVTVALSGTGTSPTPDPTPTSVPDPEPAPSVPEIPSAPDPGPEVTVVDPPVNLQVGEGAVLIDGVLVDVSITPLTGAGGAPTWAVRGPDFSLEFQPEPVGNSDALSGPSQGLSSSPGSWLNVTGDGYQTASMVKAYLISRAPTVRSSRSLQPRSAEVVYLGEVEVTDNGTFDIRVIVPASVPAGDYVLQINGLSPQGTMRSVNMALTVESGMTTRSMTKAAFFKGRAAQISRNGQRKLGSMVAGLPKVRQDVRVEITAVSVSLDDVESDLRLAARRGRELRDYLSDSGVQGTYSVTIRTEDQLRSADKAPPLMVSSKGKPLTTVRITYDTTS